MQEKSQIIKAPFTDEHVKKLNEYQNLGIMHEFTCANGHGGKRVLTATNNGWVCPTCNYTQDWFHSFMVDIDTIKRNHENSFFDKLQGPGRVLGKTK